MKFPLQLTILLLFLVNAYGQDQRGVEVGSIEYVWQRLSPDNRAVLVKDTLYQQILKNSISKSLSERWRCDVSVPAVEVNKMPFIRLEPKFKPAVSNADTSKLYAFIQLFDQTMEFNPNYPQWSATIKVRYRLLKGAEKVAMEDKSASFNILRRDAPIGQISINHFPFYPSEFQYACDTIANAVINGSPKSQNEIWLDPACAYVEDTLQANDVKAECRFDRDHQAMTFAGLDVFTIIHDSVKTFQTGKNRHRGANTAGGVLTLLSNIDTEKQKSTLYTADHTYTVGSDTYHCFVNYIDTKVADRRRVKDEDGFKSVEASAYRPGWSEIKNDVSHVITYNGDTIASYKIQFRRSNESFAKMWNGHETSTVDSLPLAFNNSTKVEVDMRGTISDKHFVLTTSDEGKIKTVLFENDKSFRLLSNSGAEGKISYNGMDARELKLATLLCMLTDKIRLIN